MQKSKSGRKMLTVSPPVAHPKKPEKSESPTKPAEVSGEEKRAAAVNLTSRADHEGAMVDGKKIAVDDSLLSESLKGMVRTEEVAQMVAVKVADILASDPSRSKDSYSTWLQQLITSPRTADVNRELQVQNDELVLEVASLQQQLETYEQKRKETEDLLHSVDKELESTLERTRMNDQEMVKLREELRLSSASIAELEQRLQEDRAERSGVQQELEQARTEAMEAREVPTTHALFDFFNAAFRCRHLSHGFPCGVFCAYNLVSYHSTQAAAALQAQLSAAETALQQSNDLLRASRDEHAQLLRSLDDAQQELTASRTERERQEEEEKQQQQQQQHVRDRDATESTDRVALMQATLLELERARDSALAENATLREQLEQSQRSTAVEVDAVHVSTTEHAATIDRLAAELQNKDERIAQLLADAQERESRLAFAESHAQTESPAEEEEPAVGVSADDAALVSLREQVASLSTELESTHERLSSAQAELAAQQHLVTSLREQVASAERRESDLVGEQQQAHVISALTADQEVAVLQMVDDLKAAHALALAERDTQIESLMEQIVDLHAVPAVNDCGLLAEGEQAATAVVPTTGDEPVVTPTTPVAAAEAGAVSLQVPPAVLPLSPRRRNSVSAGEHARKVGCIHAVSLRRAYEEMMEMRMKVETLFREKEALEEHLAVAELHIKQLFEVANRKRDGSS